MTFILNTINKYFISSIVRKEERGECGPPGHLRFCQAGTDKNLMSVNYCSLNTNWWWKVFVSCPVCFSLWVSQSELTRKTVKGEIIIITKSEIYVRLSGEMMSLEADLGGVHTEHPAICYPLYKVHQIIALVKMQLFLAALPNVRTILMITIK